MATRSSSPIVGPSKAKCDILTTVPPEILVKILAQIPLKSYLDLVHTSRALRNFIKLNASRICNEAIRLRFHLESKLLLSQLNSGWLIPTHEKIEKEEDIYASIFVQHQCLSFTMNPMESPKEFRLFSLLGQTREKTSISISLASPGPQFLHFLESGIFTIHPKEDPTPLPYRIPGSAKREKVVLEGKTYFFDFAKGMDYEHHWYFALFMQLFNMRYLYVKNDDLELPCYTKGTEFPRELIWFYGVERLRLVEKEFDEDWRNLPMLLWE